MFTFIVPEMTCSHCQSTIEKAIHQLDGTAEITIDLASHRLDVVSKKSTSGAITAALKSAGYGSQPAEV